MEEPKEKRAVQRKVGEKPKVYVTAEVPDANCLLFREQQSLQPGFKAAN